MPAQLYSGGMGQAGPMLTSSAVSRRGSILQRTGKVLPLIGLLLMQFFAATAFVQAKPCSNISSTKYLLKGPSKTAGITADSVDFLVPRDSQLLVNIEHRRGIGSIEFLLKRGKWPNKVLVCFKGFQRLENVTISSGTEILSTSSTETPLKDTRRCKFSRWTDQGKIYFCFENFCSAGTESLKLSWVDFYRQ